MATALKNLSEIIGEVPSGNGKNIVVVTAEWNEGITSKLRDGAMEALLKHGVQEENIVNMTVPGCFELPFAAVTMIEKYDPDAVICLGCVIQGDTPHFDYVCQATTEGILKVGLETYVPVIFGVLTVDTLEQAEDRAGGKHGNKGFEAGISALKMTPYKL